MITSASTRSAIALLCKPHSELQEYAAHQFRQLNKRQSARLLRPSDENSPYSMSVAESPAGQVKNRYSNIIPFNRNRIKLERPDLIGEEFIDPSLGDDYVNASLIEPPFNIPRRYIATQGPLRSTVGDFWRMVIEQNTQLIVCLSPERENDQEKCARYWPVDDERKEVPLLTTRADDESRHQTLKGLLRLRNPEQKKQARGNVVVRLENVEPEQVDKDADCIVRHIQVTFVDTFKDTVIASSVVTQLQFLGWADFSVPEHTKPVVALSRLADRLQPQNGGPVVVHCSAGCGRTGTFCVVNSGMEWIRSALHASSEGEDAVELPPDIVYMLADTFRKQRTTMVQASSQYFFCYRALRDGYRQEFEPNP